MTNSFVHFVVVGMAAALILATITGCFPQAGNAPTPTETPDSAAPITVAVGAALSTRPQPRNDTPIPESTLISPVQATAAPPARTVTTAETAAATRRPTTSSTATPRLTATPKIEVKPVNLPNHRRDIVTTDMGQRIIVDVRGFRDSPLRYRQLVTIIEEIESLLQMPYPAPHVTMRQVRTLAREFCGRNQIEYLPRVSGDPYRVQQSNIRIKIDEDCDDTYSSIVHETAHTWFHGNEYWVDEGLANVVENIIVQRHKPDQASPYPPQTYCKTYANIAALEHANPPRQYAGPASGVACNYRLGDGIFGALHQHHGESRFLQMAGKLARGPQEQKNFRHNVTTVHTVMGIDATATAIINDWYSGQPQMRRYQHLDLVEWDQPPTIDGEYIHLSGHLAQPGLIKNLILGDHPYCSQFTIYDEDAPGWDASLSDPLPVGWYWDEKPEAIITNYEIDESDGWFSVTARINDDTILQKRELSLTIDERVHAGADGYCKPGLTYAETEILRGPVADHLKAETHHHLDAIRWDSPPAIISAPNGSLTVSISGQAQPNTVNVTHIEGFCSQFDVYEYDEFGYHYIDSVRPMLPNNQRWTDDSIADIISGDGWDDGRFEAVIQFDAVISRLQNPLLVIRNKAQRKPNTDECEDADAIGVVELQ